MLLSLVKMIVCNENGAIRSVIYLTNPIYFCIVFHYKFSLFKVYTSFCVVFLYSSLFLFLWNHSLKIFAHAFFLTFDSELRFRQSIFLSALIAAIAAFSHWTNLCSDFLEVNNCDTWMLIFSYFCVVVLLQNESMPWYGCIKLPV